MNKIALVTGAYKGLGFEWVRQLAKDGYTVYLTARSLKKAQKAVDQLEKEGFKAIPKALDVTNEEELSHLASEIENEYGHIDLIVNNAGINSKDDPDKSVFMKSFRLQDLDAGEVLRHIHVNGIAPVLVVKHFKALLEKSEKPVVVNISSWLGSIAKKDFGGHYGYATSKAALNMMNKAMALEIKQYGITSIVLNPGWVQTDMGGSKAPLTAEQSVRSTIDKVLNTITLEQTGEFFQWDGTPHPW